MSHTQSRLRTHLVRGLFAGLLTAACSSSDSTGGANGQNAAGGGGKTPDGGATIEEGPGLNPDGGSSPGDGSDNVDDLPKPDAGTPGPTSTVGTGQAASCTESTLRAAIAAAPDRSVLRFDCGSAPVTIALSSPLYLENKTLTFDGITPGLVTLDGQGKTRIFVFSHHWWYEKTTPRLVLVLRNLTLAHGHGAPLEAASPLPPYGNHAIDKDGGAILLSHQRGLLLDHVTFRENTAVGQGGAIAGAAEELVYGRDVTFDGGFADGATTVNGVSVSAKQGGAVWFGGSTEATFQRVTFRRHRVSDAAGALHLGWGRSKLRVDQATFAQNNSTNAGEHNSSAMLLHSTPYARITNSKFESNVGPTAAIKILLANASFQHVAFTNNTSNGYGAAVMVDGTYHDNDPAQLPDAPTSPGVIEMDDVTFSTNKTTQVTRAGGIYTCLYKNEDVFRVTNSRFTGNVAGGASDGAPGGAGIYIDCAGDLTTTYALQHVTLTDNTSEGVTDLSLAALRYNTKDTSHFMDVKIISGGNMVKTW